MVKRKKKSGRGDFILIAAAILLLVLLGSVSYLFPSGSFKQKAASRQELEPIGRVIATIDFGNGAKRAFEGEIVKNESLMDVLILITRAGDLRYRLDGESNIAAIDNFVASDGKTWQWYVNEKPATAPTYETILKPGDRILVKYE